MSAELLVQTTARGASTARTEGYALSAGFDSLRDGRSHCPHARRPSFSTGRLLTSMFVSLHPCWFAACMDPTSAAQSVHQEAQPTAFANLGSDYFRSGDSPSARDVLAKGVQVYPEDAQLRFMLANAHFRLGEWRLASTEYSEAGRLRPNHPDTHLNLGFAHWRQGVQGAALDAWQRASEQSPDDALPMLACALGLLETGSTAAARALFLKAADLDPGWGERLAIDIRWTPGDIDQLRQLAENREESKGKSSGPVHSAADPSHEGFSDSLAAEPAHAVSDSAEHEVTQ